MTPKVREIRGWAIGPVDVSPEAPRIDGAVTTFRETEVVQGEEVLVSARAYGGVVLRYRGPRALFVGKLGAGMAFPSRYRPRFLVFRARHALASRLARSVGAELFFPPRTGAEEASRAAHPAGGSRPDGRL